MLSIYRRHRTNCPHSADRVSKKCRCGLWLSGTLFGKPYRKSAKTRNWEAAERAKRKLESGGQESKPEPKVVTIDSALAAFITDCGTRNLNRSTLSKYKLLSDRLREYASDHAIVALSAFTYEHAIAFRATWKGAPRTLAKTLERARAIGKFWFENGWTPRNWFKTIKPPQVKISPRLPFSDDDVQNILEQAEDDRELAFILVLRHTGLRIGDAALLPIFSLSDGRIYLRTTKTGTPVSVVIPPNLVSLLKAIAPRGGYFFLRGDSTSMHTCADLWRRRFKILCKKAKVRPDHPHRMRHTLAADLLSKGASVEDVAAILGNSPAIVGKYYSQWIKSRQDRLDVIVSQTWQPALLRVK